MSCWRYTPTPKQDRFQDLLEAICPDFLHTNLTKKYHIYSNKPQLFSAEVVLCMHKTTILCQFGLIICHQLTNSYLHQFSTIFGGNYIRLTVSSFDSQANQSNQSSIQRELLMPSPEVIDLTLSDDEIQPDPIRSDQGTSTPTQATNRFRTSSSTPPTSGINRTRRILPVIQGTFAAIERAENYLPLQPFFNNTHFGQTLINCIHNQHRIGIPDEYFVETCINTYTQNGFVTKEFVKIDKDSQTQDYTIIYIKFQGQTPPFSTHNRDIFERLLPTPFPQVGDILTEEEDSESEQELIA